MIIRIIKILAILILAILQLTFVPLFGIQNAWPDLIMLVVLVLMFLEFDLESLLVAALGGLILDLASPLIFGYHVMILVIFAVFTKLLLSRFLTEPNTFIISLFLGLCAILNDFIIMLVGRDFPWTSLLINGFYSALVGFLLYRLGEYWLKKQPLTKMVINEHI